MSQGSFFSQLTADIALLLLQSTAVDSLLISIILPDTRALETQFRGKFSLCAARLCNVLEFIFRFALSDGHEQEQRRKEVDGAAVVIGFYKYIGNIIIPILETNLHSAL